MISMRINQYIASAGICSRRKADDLIQEGRVKINGAVLMNPGYHVEEGDVIEVDGRRIEPEQKKVYYLLNKPAGYVTWTADKEGRPVVTELVPDEVRVFPVGRLDYNTSGLLILTNDGELSNRLMHPSHEFDKKYLVRAQGIVTIAEAKRLEKGIDIGGFVTSPAEVELIRHDRNSTLAEIIIHEGKNRQVRRMFKAIGHPVLELCRTGLGSLTIGRLAVGQCRKLSPAEVEYLKRV
jgi:23S rRNA pseudouridine2605 synthase